MKVSLGREGFNGDSLAMSAVAPSAAVRRTDEKVGQVAALMAAQAEGGHIREGLTVLFLVVLPSLEPGRFVKSTTD
jgi:hypothetical protein